MKYVCAFVLFFASLLFINGEDDILKDNNEYGIFDPFIILRRCPNLPCQYTNDDELRPLCPQISTFELLPNQHIDEIHGEARDYHKKDGVLDIYNIAGAAIHIYQIDHHGNELFDKELEAHEHFEYYTFEGAVFRIKDATNRTSILMEFVFSGHNGKAFVSACALPTNELQYNVNGEDDIFNIFVSENLSESFFWWKNARAIGLIGEHIDPSEVKLTTLDSYPNFDELQRAWDCFDNKEGNHHGIIRGKKFNNTFLRKLMNKNNVLTVASAIEAIGKVTWRRPIWGNYHLGVFKPCLNHPNDGINVDLMYVSEDNDDTKNTKCYLTLNTDFMTSSELRRLLYTKHHLISGRKTSIGRTINLKTEDIFSETPKNNMNSRSSVDSADIWSIDMNAFSLENIAARTLRHRLPKISLTAINAFHHCICSHVCNPDVESESQMSVEELKIYKTAVNKDRFPLHADKKAFHAALLRHNIKVLPYNATTGFPTLGKSKGNTFDSDEYVSSWDKFWLYWEVFKPYSSIEIDKALKSFHGTFPTQFCSTALHYSHRVELQHNILQAVKGLKLSLQSQKVDEENYMKLEYPNFLTISLSNVDHAPLHDIIFIEKHILNLLLMENQVDKDVATLKIQGKKIRFVYSTKFEYNYRAHGKRHTHWPKHVDAQWENIMRGPNDGRQTNGHDKYKNLASHDEMEL
eukprot:g9235.t1